MYQSFREFFTDTSQPFCLLVKDFFCSCWLNIGSNVAWVTIIPICISAWTTVIFVEAAGMNAFRPLMGRNTVKYLANT